MPHHIYRNMWQINLELLLFQSFSCLSLSKIPWYFTWWVTGFCLSFSRWSEHNDENKLHDCTEAFVFQIFPSYLTVFACLSAHDLSVMNKTVCFSLFYSFSLVVLHFPVYPMAFASPGKHSPEHGCVHCKGRDLESRERARIGMDWKRVSLQYLWGTQWIRLEIFGDVT